MRNKSGHFDNVTYMPNMSYLAYLAYLAYMPHGQSAITMVNMGIYKKHSEKLAQWSKLELIWFIVLGSYDNFNIFIFL